jgi:hypothetical protein
MKKNLLLIFIIAFSSCSSTKSRNGTSSRELLDDHSIRFERYWKDSSGQSLENKVHDELPSEVSDFVKIWQKSIKKPKEQKPSPKAISEDKFVALFKQALKDLPSKIKSNMNKRLKGIFLIDGIGASIFTLQLKNEHGPINQFIAFCDKKILNQPINEWYKWRELTAFTAQAPYDIVAELSEKNDTYHTIQYAALQLYAIMLSFDQRFYPRTRRAMVLEFNKYPLLQASWKIEQETVTSIYNEHEAANNLSFIRYYSKDNSAFTLARLSNYYAFLEETNFVNLYAFMGPSRDFVESVAHYLYTEKLRNPFKLTFKRGDETLRVFNSCWKEQRCREKAKIVQKLLQDD